MASEVSYTDNLGTTGLANTEFLLRIQALAEANGWVTLRYSTADANSHELILQGEGLAATDEIFVGFRAYKNVGADVYNLSAAGFTGYVDGNTFITQPGYFESGIPGHNLRIDYWLTVNAQRIAFGLKVGTPVYEHGYAGKFLPYASPSQFPYPVVVAGMLTAVPETRYSDTSHSFGYRGNRDNLKFRHVDGLWRKPYTWPWENALLAGATISLRDCEDSYSLQPVILQDSGGIFGELDGVFHISGFNNVTENTLEIEGVDYVVLQDVARTGFNDYLALRLD